MTLKLSEVKKLEDSKFEIIFLQDGQLKSVVISQQRHWIDEIQDYLSVFNSENPDFYNLWGYADFRKDVSQAINILAKKPELQTV